MNPVETNPLPAPAGFKVVEPNLPPRALDQYDAPSQMAGASSRRFHAMAKPGGPTGNLDCDYCYYLGQDSVPRQRGPVHWHQPALHGREA